MADGDRTAQVAAIAAAWHRAFHGWKNRDDGVCPDDSRRAEALYDAGLRSGALPEPAIDVERLARALRALDDPEDWGNADPGETGYASAIAAEYDRAAQPK